MSLYTLGGVQFHFTSETLEMDKAGLVTSTVRYVPHPQRRINLGLEGPRRGENHPLDARLKVDSASMTYENAEVVCLVKYAGMDNDEAADTGREDRSGAEYSLSYGTQEEPIETHPDFATFAGTPDAPLNGAVFVKPDGTQATEASPEEDSAKNDEYKFDRFASGAKMGVESYLDAGRATYTQRYVSRTRPTSAIATVGKKSAPPFAPSFAPREWLYMGMDYTQRGGVYEVTNTWTLSGPGGWDDDIY